MEIQTNANIISELLIRSTGFNIEKDRYEIKYRLRELAMIGGKPLNTKEPTLTLIDTPEVPILNEAGEQIGTTPAVTDLTDYLNLIFSLTSKEELIEAAQNKAIEHAGLVQWIDPTDDLLDDPNAYDIQPWVENEFVVPGFKRQWGDTVYVVKANGTHTTQSNWRPDRAPAIWEIDTETGEGEPYPAWVTGNYPLGAKVAHSGQCWESAVPNNVWEPGGEGIGDNIWFTIDCI